MMLARARGARASLSLAARRGLAGHSKWANIRKKKGGLDAARGAYFTKLARTVEVAARLAKGDRSHAVLASAVARAKAARLPKKTLDAAVARGGGGGGGGGGDVAFHLTYEGTLPGGVGVVVEALTDNKNRTVNDLRSTFRKNGGALGAPNSVVWAWRRVGELRVAAVADADAHEALFDAALDAGADDVGDRDAETGDVVVSCAAAATAAVRDGLAAAGFEAAADLVWRPDAEVGGAGGDALWDALDALDDLDDVAAVFHNAAAHA